jgi:3-hydroxybutyryl-CoA dehydrogenase
MTESLGDYSLRKKIKESGQGQLKLVGVIGGGSMGREIIQIVSQHGINVVFIDLTKERVESIMKDIDAALNEIINKWGLTQSEKRAILSRIKGTTDYSDIKDCEIVIESINIKQRGSSTEARQDVFRKIEAVVSPTAIIASNNSSLMISDLASALKHPERTVGLSFITPASTVKIVEVVRGLETNDKTYDFAIRFVKMLDKKPITLYESPGNISTRLIITLINEACELLMEGVASVQCIDDTMKIGYGLQFGPFELADRVGLDKVLKVMNNLYQEFGSDKFKPSPIIKRLVRANFLGKKVLRGFYKYENGKIISQAITATEFN